MENGTQTLRLGGNFQRKFRTLHSSHRLGQTFNPQLSQNNANFMCNPPEKSSGSRWSEQYTVLISEFSAPYFKPSQASLFVNTPPPIHHSLAQHSPLSRVKTTLNSSVIREKTQRLEVIQGGHRYLSVCFPYSKGSQSAG